MLEMWLFSNFKIQNFSLSLVAGPVSYMKDDKVAVCIMFFEGMILLSCVCSFVLHVNKTSQESLAGF